MSEMTVAATASRAVLGCMNDAVVQLQAYPRGRLGEVDWRDVELYLSQNIYSLTNYETPQVKALELFGITSGVIRVQQGPWLH